MTENWMARGRCTRFPQLGWIKDRDQVTVAETLTMAVVCARCPVFDACRSFAEREGITAGFWAGEHREQDVESYGGAA